MSKGLLMVDGIFTVFFLATAFILFIINCILFVRVIAGQGIDHLKAKQWPSFINMA